MSNQQIEAILDEVGRHMGTDEDWGRLAMACLDQAMVSCAVQDEIAAILRRAGLETESGQ